jgi:hypothetical protein
MRSRGRGAVGSAMPTGAFSDGCLKSKMSPKLTTLYLSRFLSDLSPAVFARRSGNQTGEMLKVIISMTFLKKDHHMDDFSMGNLGPKRSSI